MARDRSGRCAPADRRARAGLDDLALMKLVAMRDQDLVDLFLLATFGVSAEAITHAAIEDDIERSVSAGANQARHALRTGALREIIEQTLAREPQEFEIEQLGTLLDALERSGM